jgi:hypothetical protein
MRLAEIISLAPGFSPVFGNSRRHSRFNGFFAARQKPLKRLNVCLPHVTGLKPGANKRPNSIKKLALKRLDLISNGSVGKPA